MSLEQINIDKVKIGMYIDNLNVSWFKHSFMSNSFLITNEKDLTKLLKLKSSTKHVYIDTEKGFYQHEKKNTQDIKNSDIKQDLHPSSHIPKDSLPLKEELKVSRKIYHNTRKVIENVFTNLKKGKNINWESLFTCIDDMTGSVLRNKDAFLNLSVIKNHDNYTFYHSLNVCCLCITMGRYMRFFKEDLFALGIGALLHDIGKIRIPAEILNKPGKLTEEEFSIVKKHPDYAFEMLSGYSGLRWDSIYLAQQHHERINGKGYPLGLKGNKINQFALIAAIADVFDAMTTERPYRKAMPPDVAMKIIMNGSDQKFSSDYITKFTQMIGVYPTSTALELDNREIGIVAAPNHLEPERPKLIIIMDSDHKKLAKPKLIDLAKEEYIRVDIARCLKKDEINIGEQKKIRIIENFIL